MPIYEYRCLQCMKRNSILQLSHSVSSPPVCVHCGSSRLERLLSRFSSPKSEEARMESLAEDDTLAGIDEQDPGSMERLMKHMSNEMGEDFRDEMSQPVDSSDEGGSDTDNFD